MATFGNFFDTNLIIHLQEISHLSPFFIIHAAEKEKKKKFKKIMIYYDILIRER